MWFFDLPFWSFSLPTTMCWLIQVVIAQVLHRGRDEDTFPSVRYKISHPTPRTVSKQHQHNEYSLSS